MTYQDETKRMVRSLLRRITLAGDTFEKHRDNVDYKSFLNIQLELVRRIVATEKTISSLKRKANVDPDKVSEAKERRALLKFLGSTVAWVLLEFDRKYIRFFSRGSDPGFISGKEGLELETLALRAGFKGENQAAVLHDITNCLRTGDLSIIWPEGILTLELKRVKGKGKLDRRARRQKRRARSFANSTAKE